MNEKVYIGKDIININGIKKKTKKQLSFMSFILSISQKTFKVDKILKYLNLSILKGVNNDTA